MKNQIRHILKEYWSEQPDKWGLLETDLRLITENLIEKHKDNWGGDQYAVIDAIQQIFEDMFQKVTINEALQSFDSPNKKEDTNDLIVGSQALRYGSWAGEQINKDLFFRIVKMVVEKESKKDIEFYEQQGQWEKDKFLNPYTKLFGAESMEFYSNGLGNKLYWAILENYDGIKNGTITTPEQLIIPQLKKYSVQVQEEISVLMVHQFTIDIEAFNETDAVNEVNQNEDGEYNYWNYENTPGYQNWTDNEEQQYWEITSVDEVKQVSEGVEKSPINEVVDTVSGGEEKLKDSGNTLIGAQYYRGWGNDKGYYAETINKDMFFKIIKTLVQYTPWEKILRINDDEPYRWAEVINPMIKVFGVKNINYSPDGLGTRMWYTLRNPKNYDGIKDGTITNANELEIPERKTFEVYMEQSEKEYVNYNYTVTVVGYNEDAVYNAVEYDEDGLYNWYDHEDSKGFNKDVYDGESLEKEVISIKEV